MNKLNNKGFAVSTILYGILALTILILMLILGIMKANKDLNQDSSTRIEKLINKCVSLEVRLENCYYEGGSCLNEKYEYDVCIGKTTTLRDKILNDNVYYPDDVASKYVTSTSGIDFSNISSDTNGKGLYYTSTNTERGQTTYYFRGDVENNYVSFGTYKEEYSFTDYSIGETITFKVGDPIIWRVVRINEDGSIRLVKQHNIEKYFYNDDYHNNAHVGYMYGTTSATGDNAYALTHTNTTNSTIKTALDDWYRKHLSNYSNLFATNAGFCNDRSVATRANTWTSNDTALGYGTNSTYYGAYNRIVNLNQPQFKCPNESKDLFTLTTSSRGNKKLTNPIGMLTIDEVIYGGGSTYTSNYNYYLFNSDHWWTMSPAYFEGSADVWCNLSNGSVSADCYYLDYGTRPVINLASNVEITGGNGTKSNPYTISTF